MANTVTAQVRYLNSEWRDWKERKERPRICSKETRLANTSLHDVEIADARPLHERGKFDLDTQGLIFGELHSAVRDFHDDEEVRSTYYGEVEALLRRHTVFQILF